MTAVLFTCAGQRVDIVSAFRRAGAVAVACDADHLAPALYHADRKALVPRVADPGYVPALAALVAEHEIRLVVPLTDLDQETLSRHREALAPALVLAPAPEVCRTMGDKYLAHAFFEEHGIASPRTWLPHEVPADARYPLLVKVREGFGSRHIYRAADERELEFFLGYTSVDSMVQEACLGEEFSIDVFCDLEGRCLNAIPRTMIQSKGGESIKGMSIQDRELIEHGARVAETVRHRRPRQRAVLQGAGWIAADHRCQPALRRCVPAAARRREPLPRHRARTGARGDGRSRASAISGRAC